MKKEDNNIFNLFVGPCDDQEIMDILLEIDNAYNKLFIVSMRKRYNVEAMVIDENHISIDGVVMDDDTFVHWLMDHDDSIRQQIEEEEGEEV